MLNACRSTSQPFKAACMQKLQNAAVQIGSKFELLRRVWFGERALNRTTIRDGSEDVWEECIPLTLYLTLAVMWV
jgi:hypothetical protein